MSSPAEKLAILINMFDKGLLCQCPSDYEENERVIQHDEKCVAPIILSKLTEVNKTEEVE